MGGENYVSRIFFPPLLTSSSNIFNWKLHVRFLRTEFVSLLTYVFYCGLNLQAMTKQKMRDLHIQSLLFSHYKKRTHNFWTEWMDIGHVRKTNNWHCKLELSLNMSWCFFFQTRRTMVHFPESMKSIFSSLSTLKKVNGSPSSREFCGQIPSTGN